jgi:hypothetical protein
MASPMTADEFVAALRAEGVRVTEHAGWRTHNRAGHGAWGPVNGVMIHHTAGVEPSDGSIVWSGRSDLPGPLAHSYLAKSGVVTMTANGRANHAGGGDPAVLAAVVNETYASAPAAPRFHDGSAGATDGNAHFYGLEISNLGTSTDPYPAVQYDAAVRWAAAICRHHGWSARSVIGHKEWSDWKNDPSFDIAKFRADVATRLAAPPNADPEDDMPLTDADVKKLWGYPGPGDDPDVHQTVTNAAKSAAAAAKSAGDTLAAVKNLGAPVLTAAQVTAIGKQLAADPAFTAAIAQAVPRPATAAEIADVIAARMDS